MAQRLIVALIGLTSIGVFAPRLASAQGTAVVEVASGDRIRGDVRRLEYGRMDFRTLAGPAPGAGRWAGTISIRWSEITLLASSEPLEVELNTGEWFVGTVSTSSPRRMVVQTASGPSRQIDMDMVVRIRMVERGFRARTTGSIGFGLVVTRDTGTYTLNGDAEHRSANHTYVTKLSFSSWLLAQDETDNLTRNDVRLDLRRRLTNRWFLFAVGEGQQDEELELDARFVAGGGIGRTLVQSNRHELAVIGGIDYDAEQFSAVGEFEHSAEAFGTVNWNWFAPESSTDANVDATTYISMDRARARFKLDASVRREMFWDLYWSVKFFEDFDSDPPIASPRSNFGVTFLFGWTF